MTYTMSRDYDRLYDLLCGGGEALGRVQIGDLKYTARIEAFHGFIYIEYHEDEKFTQTTWSVRIGMSTSALALRDECTRLSLEWLAPVDIAEIIEKGDVMHEAMVRYQMDVDDDPPMKHRDMMEAWTTATDKHRTP